MALQELQFTFKAEEGYRAIPVEWSHTGIVGSGDMEVLLQSKKLNGQVEVLVRTPVRGFDDIWQKVLERFVCETNIGDVCIEVNDNNSTPYIVSMRLKQAVAEAFGGGGL